MSGYRRFVAYIYRYREGKKEKNTGYVKVEARNGLCRMQMRIQSAGMGNQNLKIFGFVREGERLFGILLGEAAGKNGVCEWRMNTPAKHFGESEYALADICGLWIEGLEGERYLTVWDDEKVDMERFTTEKAPKTSAIPVPSAEQGMSAMPDISAEQGMSAMPNPSARPELPVSSSAEEGAASVKAQEEEEAPVKEKSQAVGLGARWQQFLYHYPGISPFADDEITQCICIALKDISFLGKNEWKFGRNPFVQQAFARYGHLLAGIHKSGSFILGIPGMYYDEQDRHLARMYGFTEVKKADSRSACVILPEGEDGDRFVYWYHYIMEM